MSAQHHRVRRPRERHRAESGVTLIELMIVVVAIAIMAGSFGSGVRRTVLEQRRSGAVRELVRMAREAKLQASVLRVAHALHVDPATGTAQVLHGETNSCLTPTTTGLTWANLSQSCINNALGRVNGTECLSADFASAPWSFPGAPSIQVSEVMPDNSQSNAIRTICFAPNGTVWHGLGTGGTLISDNVVPGTTSVLGGGVVFRLDLIQTGLTFPPKQLLVPLNGLAKVL